MNNASYWPEEKVKRLKKMPFLVRDPDVPCLDATHTTYK